MQARAAGWEGCRRDIRSKRARWRRTRARFGRYHESSCHVRSPHLTAKAVKLDRFQRFALITTIATYLLIGIGGLVRAAGAGLGCPDWPKCFDRWIPPTDVSQVPPSIDPSLFNVTKAWIEWLNRLTGVIVGFLIFGALVLAILHHRRSRRVLW